MKNRKKKQNKPVKDRRLRIIWNSNAPFSTSGYGQQMALILPLLRDEGWIQAAVAFYGLEGGIIDWNGIPLYPKMGDAWGSDALVNHGKDFKCDISITQQDVWPIDPNALGQFKNWIPYLPVDHDPIPEAVFSRIKSAYRVIAYSKYAKAQLSKKGIHSTYIPLMVDTDVFRPFDRATIRKEIGIPEDIFLFGMVAANKDNPPRKSFQEVLDAFKIFHDKHPKSGIYFNTNTVQPEGFPIDEYAKSLGLENNVYRPPLYELFYKIDQKKMAMIYGAFDCLLAPSTNEGFGVPIIEAQACGIPVITNNFTSMPELIVEGETGYLCEIATKRYTPLRAYIGIPSVQSIYDNMEKMFIADRVEMGKKAREKAKEYDAKKVVREMWNPYLEKVQAEIYRTS